MASYPLQLFLSHIKFFPLRFFYYSISSPRPHPQVISHQLVSKGLWMGGGPPGLVRTITLDFPHWGGGRGACHWRQGGATRGPMFSTSLLGHILGSGWWLEVTKPPPWGRMGWTNLDQRQDRLNNNIDLVHKEVTGVSFILR
jgi:hypothetical protein